MRIFRRTHFLLMAISIVLLLSRVLSAQFFDPKRHLSLDKVKPGMTGYGLSVFKGTKIERFDVKVLDVIPNFNTKLAVIIVELSKQDLRRTGIIQGMSGSPVYLKDPTDGKYKIAGAVAYGWPLSRQGFARGGVQPIEQMLAVPTKKSREQVACSDDRRMLDKGLSLLSEPSDGEMSPEKFDRFYWAGLVHKGKSVNLESQGAGIKPLTTPFGVSGISTSGFAKLQAIFHDDGISLVQAGSGGNVKETGETKLVPGGVLSVPLLSGDMDLAGIGTVTECIGNRFWGFGHSMFAQGPIDLPVGAGVIHTIIANRVASFKLGSSFRPVGTMYHDQTTAVAGEVGTIPKLVPIRVNVNFEGRRTTYNYKLAIHRKLAPLLAMVAVRESVIARKVLPELHVVKYTATIDFEKFGKLKFTNTSSDSDLGLLLSDIAEPINTMLNNDFERIKVKSVNVDVDVSAKSSLATIVQVKLDRMKYRPGQMVRVNLRCQRMKRTFFTRTVEFSVPKDLPDGSYDLLVGGLQLAIGIDKQMNKQIYSPKNIADTFRMIKRIMQFRSDRVFAAINTRMRGLGIEHYGLPNLPGSKMVQLEESDPGRLHTLMMYKTFEFPGNDVIDGSGKVRLVISRK